MLVAHIDDSGNNKQGPAFILAGYVATVQQWVKFSDQWQMAMDLKPKLDIVKVQDALRRENHWGRLTAAQRDERLKRFAAIIHKHVRMAVVASASWEDLKRIEQEFFPKATVRKEKFNPYCALFNGLAADLIRNLKRWGINEKIDFVFDEQGASGEMALRIFDDIWDDIPQEIKAMIGGRPIHRSDSDVLPLQAAHTIAWLHRRHAHETNEVYFPKYKPSEPSLRKLGKIATLYCIYPYERLADYFSRAQARLQE
jgi:hypothetical protein